MTRLALALLVLLIAALPAEARMVLNRGNGGEIQTLDPQLINGTWESNIEGDILMGLATQGPAAEPLPGAATSWDTSPDGKTWIFHLRKHVWSDGVPVTAQDFIFAYRRILDPKTHAPYAYNLWLFKNAQAISDGKLPPSALGVEAPDDATLVVHLEHPAAYLPQLLTHQTADPIPRHVVLAKGPAWVQVKNYVANGPYIPKEWVPNDHITLVKNPRFYDAAHVRIDQVNYYPTQDTHAGLKRLRAGELDTQNPIPADEIDWMRANMADALHLKPYLGLSYLTMNFAYAPLRDIRVRKALNLVYNREIITQKVLRLGDPPAYSYVPPHVANYPGGAVMDFKAMPYPARVKLAQWLMQQAGYGPTKHLQLVYETTFDPDNKRVAAILQSMVKQIYVDMEIAQVDVQIHYRNLQQHQFQISGAAWIADFNDASNFLDLLRSDSGNNYGQYKNPKFDAAMNAAQQEVDGVKRGKLLLSAEKIALADYPWVVTRFRVTDDLVQPYVKGWIDNVLNFNHTRWLWIEGKPGAR